MQESSFRARSGANSVAKKYRLTQAGISVLFYLIFSIVIITIFLHFYHSVDKYICVQTIDMTDMENVVLECKFVDDK